MVTIRIAIAAVVIAVVLLSIDGFAQPANKERVNSLAAVAELEQALVNAIARAEPSVVAISRSTPAAAAPAAQSQLLAEDIFRELRPANVEASTASVVAAGVLIEKGGLVLTQYLAVAEGDSHKVTTIEGKTYAAAIRAADPRSGLAVLAIDPRNSLPRKGGTAEQSGDFPSIRFGDAARLRKGQFVIAIGNPFGVVSDGQPTASWGIVTNLARKAPPDTNLNEASGPLNDYRTTIHHLGTLIQTDAKLGWSAGGGALVNLQGELVGLTTTVATIAGHEQPAGYAIPMDATMRRVIDALKAGREVEYGMLGISFGSATDRGANDKQRVVVGQVFPGSPAADAGLQSGDVITRVNERPILDSDALQLAVSVLPPQAAVSVEYERGGRLSTTDVKLAKLAVAGKAIATVRPESWCGIRVDYAIALEAAKFLAAIDSRAYDAEGCVLVADVAPDSPAANAGIRQGMFISHVGEQRVRTPQEFYKAVRNVESERDLRVTQPLEPPTTENNASASTRKNP